MRQGKLAARHQERQIERSAACAPFRPMYGVAASNVNLEGEVRADVPAGPYFALVFPIVIPLRDRRDDIPMLIDHFLRVFRERTVATSSPVGRAIDALLAMISGQYPELQT